MENQQQNNILAIKNNFVKMGKVVSNQIHQATKAFLEHDTVLAEQVIAKDQQINNDEVQLERQVFDLLILKSPMATDFRETMSILKASSDLERIGDDAIHIAQQTLRMTNKPTLVAAEKIIQQLTYQVRQMLEGVDRAYIDNDYQAALIIAQADSKVDQLYLQLRRLVLNQQIQDKQQLKATDIYLTVGHQLERVSDHIVNIAEWIVYAQTGRIVELSVNKN